MRIAIIGTGITGLGAARALAGVHDVELFEAAPRPGGHVYTVDVEDDAVGPLAVDMGFIVCNRRNYPRFFQLLRELGVATRPTAMAFSVALPDRDLEWGSASLGAMFADRRRLLDRDHWRFLVEVGRLLRRARADLESPLVRDASLDEYLAARRVPTEVRDQFVVPLAAALWSLAPARCGDFPAETYLRFLAQHGMLEPLRPLQWETVVGGSRRYVDALLAQLPAKVHLATPVRAIHRGARGVELDAGASSDRFDRVIITAGADRALAMLARPTELEQRLLGAIRYSRNRVVLHRDASYLPRRVAARAAWNYVADPRTHEVAVTYWMNKLQGLPTATPYLVTLNPRGPIAAPLHEVELSHPQFDRAALAAVRALPALQGRNLTYFAGAYTGYGFHEDGLRAGQDVAALLLADAERQAVAA